MKREPYEIAVRIEIEYANGDVRRGIGEVADEVLRWWQSCEALSHLQGKHYKGPQLRVVGDTVEEVEEGPRQT